MRPLSIVTLPSFTDRSYSGFKTQSGNHASPAPLGVRPDGSFLPARGRARGTPAYFAEVPTPPKRLRRPEALGYEG